MTFRHVCPLAVVLVALVACSSVDDDATAVEDIRGGRVELGHPEVGLLESAGGLCTGTLIAER